MSKWQRACLASAVLTLFAVVALWATRSLWPVGAIGTHYDWGWPLTDWQVPLKHFLWSWDGRFLGNPVIFNFGWIMAGGLSFVGTILAVSVQVMLKIWLAAAIFLAGTGMTWLLRRRGLPWWVSLLMGLVYALYPTLFVRFIVGFVAYIMAYALLPWWLGVWWSLPETDRPQRLIPLAALLYAVMTAQQQFSVIILLIMVVDLWLGRLGRRNLRRQLIALGVSLLTVLIFHLPWLWLSFRGGVGLASDLGQASSSLALISSLPHDLWRTLFGIDHHITYPIFDTLRYGSTFAVSALVLLGLFFVGVRQSRAETRLVLVLLGLTWPLSLGPVDATKNLYIWVYQHMPLANLFRETFHWSVLTAACLVIGAAFGLTWLSGRRWLGRVATLVAAVALIGLARPFANGNFFGYLSPQRAAYEYGGLTVSRATSLDLGRTFFLPSLGFIKDRQDKIVGAANSDIFAESTNRPQLPYVSSTLDLPDAGTELRNALLVSWYQLPGAPSSAAGYLRALGVSEVVTRPHLVSNFIDLFPAKSLESLRRHWATADYDDLTQAQSGVKRVEQTTSWSRYEVVNAAPKITLAKQPVLAAYDWSAIDSQSDAVFYREDLAAVNALDRVVGLPVVSSTEDYLAAGWQSYDHRRDLVVDAGSSADLGWVKKNSVWWRSAALAQAKETYYFTSTEQPIVGQVSLNTGETYHWLAKIWQSPRSKQVVINVGGQSKTIMTSDASEGHFVWHDLGEYKPVTAVNRVSVVGEGDTALAQLLLVPAATYASGVADRATVRAAAPAPTGNVTFTADNPTSYDLSVTTDRESWLVVRESFDSGWELHLGDQVYRPVPVNGYAMAFSIPGGSWSGHLVYAPQRFYRVLQTATVLYLGGLLLLSIWTPRRRQRRQAISL